MLVKWGEASTVNFISVGFLTVAWHGWGGGEEEEGGEGGGKEEGEGEGRTSPTQISQRKNMIEPLWLRC